MSNDSRTTSQTVLIKHKIQLYVCIVWNPSLHIDAMDIPKMNPLPFYCPERKTVKRDKEGRKLVRPI